MNTFFKYLKIALIVWFSLPVIMVVGIYVTWQEPEIAANVTRDEAPISDLPGDAANISYHLPGSFGPNTHYEFDTSEESFLKWVKTWRRIKLDGPYYGEDSISCYDHAKREYAEYSADDAISFYWQEEDRGVYFLFDRKTGRAYFHSHSR